MWMQSIWMIISILIRHRAKIFRTDASFARYGGGFSNKADWRRSNVNILIKKIHETIREAKPWVKFGISPFGIYRNEKTDPSGKQNQWAPKLR